MTASTQETVELLSQVPVFAPLAPGDLELVAEVCHPRRFGAGEVVFREGDQSNTCYVVRSGHARAVREHADGRQIALATFGPGDIFGELAMFDDERRSATVRDARADRDGLRARLGKAATDKERASLRARLDRASRRVTRAERAVAALGQEVSFATVELSVQGTRSSGATAMA